MISGFFSREAICEITAHGEHVIVSLIENDDRVTISQLPKDTIVIKLDVDENKFKRKTPYLHENQKFVHMGCDFCIIIPSLMQIIFLEMKSESPAQNIYVNQFRISQIFMQYCLRLWEYVNESKHDGSWTYKFLLFSKNADLNRAAISINGNGPFATLQFLDRRKMSIKIYHRTFDPKRHTSITFNQIRNLR